VLFRKSKPENQSLPNAAVAPADDLRSAQPAEAPVAAQPTVGQVRAMKRQLTSSDVRTDRLVRQLREEIEGVRDILDEFAEDQEQLLLADAELIADDPKAAASLPGPLLVRTILALAEERDEAIANVSVAAAKARDLEESVNALRLTEASLRGRMETFEDVIAALHNNLEDLRFARDQVALPAEQPRPRLKAIHDTDDAEAAGGRA
jgi:chromosome segregation ATPase